MSHHATDSFSFFAEQDSYKPQLPQHFSQGFLPSQLYSDLPGQFDDEPASEDIHSVQIPQTDFDPFYSDIVNLDSDLDANFLAISDLGLPEGIRNSIPGSNSVPGNTYGYTNMTQLLTQNHHERQRSFRQPSMQAPSSSQSHIWTQRLPSIQPSELQSTQLQSTQLQSTRHHSPVRQQHLQQTEYQHQHQQQHQHFAPAMKISRFATDLPSDPPNEYDQFDQFNELASSPPSSPEKLGPMSSPQRRPPARGLLPPLSFDMRSQQRSENQDFTTMDSQTVQKLEPRREHRHLDSLGISHTSFHRPRSSVIISSDLPQISQTGASSSADHGSASDSGFQGATLSPYMAPPSQRTPISPYLQKSMQGENYIYNPAHTLASSSQPSLPRHLQTLRDLSSQPDISASDPNLPLPMPPQLPQSAYGIPNLSPTLSDASLSPDPSSPEHVSEFSWQPIVTVPHSDDSEAIIEQQRKPKLKRKSRLPDGVVDEYIGTTDTEHVYICLYPNCNRLFKRTYNLRSHIQTHLCDRPYTCPLCDANFVRPHDLRRHERCHSTAKPFVCPCGKGFNRQDAMQRHRLREICVGGISSGIPKSPKPRGRPKGRRNTPSSTPDLNSEESPYLSPHIGESSSGSSPAQFEGTPAQLSKTPELGSITPRLGSDAPKLAAPPQMLEPIPEGFGPA